jgi:hypothetical protein
MHEDALACKREATGAYESGQPNPLWAFGGAAGILVGAAVDSPKQPAMKISDISPYVENCMRQKGYAANPDNKP